MNHDLSNYDLSKHDLSRFLEAQDGVFEIALNELKGCQKRSHWMWFIFPNLTGWDIVNYPKNTLFET